VAAQSLAPVTLDVVNFGASIVQFPVGNASQLGEVLVANESGVPLDVTIGGQTWQLEAWTVDKYALSQVSLTMTLRPINPLTLGALQQPPVVTAAARVMFTLAGDTPIPGTYPASLTRLAAQYGQPTEMAPISLPGSPLTGSFSLPVGTLSMSIVTVVAAGDRANLGLVGAASGFGYYGNSLGTSAYEIIGIDSVKDPILNYTISHSGAGTDSWFICALPFPPPGFIQRTPAPWQVGQFPAPMNVSIPASSSFTWVTPPTNQRMRVWSSFLHWETSTHGFGAIKGAGTTGGLANYDQKATNFLHYYGNGVPLQPSEALLVSNDDAGGAGQNIKGGIVVSFE
jgi:hypothetical protein